MPIAPNQDAAYIDKRTITYRERNFVLRAMGFSSYADYLSSELWKSIRERVLALSDECFICGVKATCIHHTAYRKKERSRRQRPKKTLSIVF